MSCCPIEVGHFEDIEAVPHHASNDGKEPGKAVRPLALESDKSEQDVEQHGRPQLPAYGMLGVAEEVADFEGLLVLLKEGFDSPTAAIKIADARSGPIKVIGQENHRHPLSVDLHPGGDAAQALRILCSGAVSEQSDLVVADNASFFLLQALSADMATEVILGPGYPKDAPPGQTEEVGEVDVSLVKDGDLPGLKTRTERHGSCVVVVRCFLNDGKGRKEGLGVQPQMHLRGGLAAAVLGPVHTVGH